MAGGAPLLPPSKSRQGAGVGLLPSPRPSSPGAPPLPAWPPLGPSLSPLQQLFLESTSSVPAVCSCLLINKATKRLPRGLQPAGGGRECWGGDSYRHPWGVLMMPAWQEANPSHKLLFSNCNKQKILRNRAESGSPAPPAMGGPAGARWGTSPFRAGGDGPRRGRRPHGDTGNPTTHHSGAGGAPAARSGGPWGRR